MPIDPKAFLDEFVSPAIDEWRSEPINKRRATIAICEIDNLFEHLILHRNPGADAAIVRAERDRLCHLSANLSVARDINDSHKHGDLKRLSARITKAQRPTQVEEGGSGLCGFGVLGGGPLGSVPRDYLVIVADDGTYHDLGEVIIWCEKYLQSELARLA